MDHSNQYESKFRNPTRQECEDQIKRTLMTETLRQGGNRHFKTAKDFMPIFEALYPSSPSLTKQVQRAVKSMNMPKDDKGFFIVDKTKAQLAQDQELSTLLQRSFAAVEEHESFETLFLRTEPNYKSYLLQLIYESETLKDKYITAIDTSNGILFLTENKALLTTMLNGLIS
ncbi:MAG: hypothetical protein K6F30_01375 [Lachnospiraceae bacterium]|nr:hypothetical protein [Lachnospiraceae bacterium]